MKVSLISTENFIISHGLRSISACLKSKGFKTELIFLPLSHHEDLPDYKPNILNKLIGLIEDSDLIGISSMAISSHRAMQVANKIKQSLSTPLMWGGIYATTCPEECLQSADMVCVGEGEEAVVELADKFSHGDDYLSTENFWFKNGKRIIKNELRPLKENLDDLPFADYELETQFILKGKKIISARDYLESNPNQIHLGQILVHTARGCPYGCAYCSNRFLNDLYKGKGNIIRKRNFSNVIDEIIQLRKKFPLASSVFITDDVFFLRSIDELKFFSREYSAKVGIPFQCYAAPPTINEDKLEEALKGGLKCVAMGIQTGSERLNRNVYNRFVSNETVMKAAHILNQYKDIMIAPTYQFIISNPYETSDDLIETIRLLQRLPKPYTLEVSHLVFFPGCKLYEKATNDGLISNTLDAKFRIDYYDERRHLKLEKKNAYLHTLIYCMRGNAFPSIMGSMPNSFTDFFIRKKDSKCVYFYWFVLLSMWRLRDVYLKTSAVLPINLRKVLSGLLKNIFIFIAEHIDLRRKKGNKIGEGNPRRENIVKNKFI